MAYATITKSNVLYQPRENVKTLITNNLTHSSVKIYSKFPNMKGGSFAGFPFIVLQESMNDPDDGYMGTSVYEFIEEIEGTIYHDADRLGDNMLRDTKQNIIESILSKTNRATLEGYGVHNIMVSFSKNVGEEYPVFNQKQLYSVGFTVSYRVETNFD